MRYHVRWLVALGVLALPAAVFGQGRPGGRVAQLDGTAQAVLDSAARTLAVDDTVYIGERVTSRDGMRIELLHGAIVQLGPDTSMTIGAHSPGRRTTVRLWLGRLWAKVTSGLGRDGFEVRTDNAVAGVRGTSFKVETDPSGGTNVEVFEGEVELSSETSDQSVVVSVGQSASASASGEIETGTASGNDPLAGVEPTAQSGEDEGTADQVPDSQKLSQARTMIERMRQILSKVLEALKNAREERDITKINCVNEKLTQVKARLKAAEDKIVSLEEKLIRRESAADDFNLISIAASHCEQLLAEVDACVGEMAVYSGETQVEVTTDETVPEGDPVQMDTALPPTLPVKIPDASPFR